MTGRRPASVIVALNTFREIIRDRILYGIVVFALLLFGISVVLGQLSFAEQARISADFGFTGIQLGSAILAIFAGSTLVSREIEKQTILTLLARPVSRRGFILGKFLGLGAVAVAVLLGLSLVLLILLNLLELPIQANFIAAIWGIWLEALILIALSLFFGSFARPVMTVVFSLSFFFIGHWISSLDFFIKKSDSEAFKIFAGCIGKIIPHLERFNWRSAPIYGTDVPIAEVMRNSFYAFAWVFFLLALTTMIFRRRDFV